MNTSIYTHRRKKKRFHLLVFFLFTIFYYLLSLCTLVFVCTIIYPAFLFLELSECDVFVHTEEKKKKKKKAYGYYYNICPVFVIIILMYKTKLTFDVIKVKNLFKFEQDKINKRMFFSFLFLKKINAY